MYNRVMLTFDVGQLVKKPEGSFEEHAVNEAVVFDPAEHLDAKSNITGKILLMKLPHEINAQIHDFKIDIECACSRCLRKYIQRITIPNASREFFIDMPESQTEAGEDAFMVDKKYWRISLLEMVRQEILLHFPAVPLCFEGCKGLCIVCGANLNEEKCPHAN